MSSFAFFAYTLALTQSPFYAALVSGCMTLAIVVMGIPAGIWADKHRPLPLMLSSTILGGAGICIIITNHFILHAPIPHGVGRGRLPGGFGDGGVFARGEGGVENPGQPRTFGAGDGDQSNKIFPGDGGGTHLGAFLHSLRPIATFVFDLCTYVFAFCTFRKLQVPDTRRRCGRK